MWSSDINSLLERCIHNCTCKRHHSLLNISWTHFEPVFDSQKLCYTIHVVWVPTLHHFTFQLALCIDRLLKHVKCGIATESLLMPRGMISFTAGHRHTVVWVMNYSGLWRGERPLKQRVNVCIWRELLYLTTALGVTPDRCCWWLILALVMKCSCHLLIKLE